MEEEKYITKEQINNIKNHPDHIALLEDTAQLINTQEKDLKGKDKIYYKLARFTKGLPGLSGISDHLMQKISPEKLSKVHVIESVLNYSMAQQSEKKPRETLLHVRDKVQNKAWIRKSSEARSR